MRVGNLLRQLLPTSVRRAIHSRRESARLSSVEQVEYNTGRLRHTRELAPDQVFRSVEIESRWLDAQARMAQFGIPDGTGGINPGDRRAIFSLICAIRPRSVLEVGTHIGASTISIASALRGNHYTNGRHGKLTTIDIRDVNSRDQKLWLKYGMHHSPADMIETLGTASFVEFNTKSTIEFAADCKQGFDFVFLDGDHSAPTVYQEIAIALNLLDAGGVILLHDYFPGLKPLWSDGSVIPGPFLAVERARREGANVEVLPLGNLPWMTKLSSNKTSLALLLRS
jgi:predicted O-methyltransferase YrrM